MDIIDDIKIHSFVDNLYIVDSETDEGNDPFASIIFLLGLNYDPRSFSLMDKLVEKGINDYIKQNVLYYDDARTIEDYLLSITDRSYSHKVPKNISIRPLGLLQTEEMINYDELYEVWYMTMIKAFCWTLGITPVIFNNPEAYHVDPLGPENKYAYFAWLDNRCYPLVIRQNNGFVFIVDNLISPYKYRRTDNRYKSKASYPLVDDLMEDVIHGTNIKNKVIYATHAALGMEMLKKYFEKTPNKEDRELYQRVYKLVSNHNFYSLNNIDRLVAGDSDSKEPPRELSPEPDIILI